MSIEVSSVSELKEAIEAGENEIVSYNEDVVNKLKAIKLAKSWGPVALATIVAAIPFVIASGGGLGSGAVNAVRFVAPSAGVATSTIVALVIVIGGTIAISLFSDWEYVEISAGGIKMSRKSS